MDFVDVPVMQREGKIETYTINTSNINYIRKWIGAKGELQSVIYFHGTDAKYIIVHKPYRDLLSHLGIKILNLEVSKEEE